MQPSKRLRLMFGSDGYTLEKTLTAIRQRFLAKSDSLFDYQTYDLEEVSLDTLKARLLTMPFFVAQRLFILKHCFGAPKATQEGLMQLLPNLSESTYVILFHAGEGDKRTTFYKWCQTAGAVDYFGAPKATDLRRFIQSILREQGIGAELPFIVEVERRFSGDTLLLVLELKKVAAKVLSEGRTQAEPRDLTITSLSGVEPEAFVVGDALRDKNKPALIRTYRQLVATHDPLLIAGMIQNFVRTIAKLSLARDQGLTTKEMMASAASLHPYVVNLFQSLPSVTHQQLRHLYQTIRQSDQAIKRGEVPPEIGVLLLLLQVHDSVHRETPTSTYA